VDTRSDLKPIFERLAPTAAQRAALLAAQSHLSVAVVCGELLAAHAGRVDDGTRLLANC
jgi:hypothetical protein